MAEEVLDLRSRTAADLAHHRAALPDEDALLRLGLDEHGRLDELVRELLQLHGDRVRDLLPSTAESLLPNQLREHHLSGLVGDVGGRVVRRAFGQQSGQQCSSKTVDFWCRRA